MCSCLDPLIFRHPHSKIGGNRDGIKPSQQGMPELVNMNFTFGA